jgi:hypothetical protein
MMTIPSFNAEASLYRSTAKYTTIGAPALSVDPHSIVPQLALCTNCLIPISGGPGVRICCGFFGCNPEVCFS